jgi:hypothetical protein
VSPKRPINADVPGSSDGEPEKPAKSEPPAKPKAKKAAAPKLLAGLVVLALVFIVAALIGGSGGDGGEDSAGESPAPAPLTTTTAEGPGEETAAEAAEALGYPSFATANTTRIAGSDAASHAAGAALAVFPSTTPSQRPAAVTLVSEEDWAGAIAASVFMAPPVRAPLLFSSSEELPEISEQALEALEPRGGKATGGASLFSVGPLAYPGKAVPIDSGDPARTAAQIATMRDRLHGGPPDHFVIASSARPDFAIPAAAWAARSGDPILFTGAKKLPPPTAALLEENPKVPVYALGPESVISPDVFREIDKIVKRVERVAGKDPVANALAFARYDDRDFGWNVNDPGHGFVLARSGAPADAAAAVPLSAAGTWGPLLLTDNAATLPAEVRSYFLDVKPGYTTDPTRAFYNHVWVIGDQEAIDVNQQAEVNELAELAKIGGGE